MGKEVFEIRARDYGTMTKDATQELRKQVPQHVAEFLARGGKIQEVPSVFNAKPGPREVGCRISYLSSPVDFVQSMV